MQRLGFERPSGARGILPLILGALAVGKGLYGAISANQTKQRNKGYIDDAYRSAQQRLHTNQGDIRESTSESLNQRGMLDGGVSPIHQAISGQPIAMGHDLASGVQNRNEGEFALERHDLDSAHSKALNENKADALNAQIGSIAGGISGAVQAYGAGQDAGAFRGAPSASAATQPSMTISDALLSGGSYAGVHPIDPLGNPSSSWHIPTGGTLNGAGASNADFNSGAFG